MKSISSQLDTIGILAKQLGNTKLLGALLAHGEELFNQCIGHGASNRRSKTNSGMLVPHTEELRRTTN